MAAENIRGDTPKQSPPVVENEQFSDIILILDKMELLLQAVTKLDKNGRYESVAAKEENRNSFLKLDRYANMFESFVKNLWSQLKDPTRFGILSVKEQALDDPKVRQAIEDLAAGKKTDAVEEFLAKYDITPKGKEQSINNQNDKEMAKQEQTTRAQTAQDGQPKYRFNESMIDWEQLKHFGLSREYLQERGLLDSMLKGYKTNQVVPISMNFGSAVLRTDARLSFQQSTQGPVVLGIHGIRQQPDLERPFFGHIFSEEDKKNLRESGNMGRVVNLRVRNEDVPSFLSIDRLTNEIVAMKAENAYIPEKISGVTLTDQEKAELREGKAIYVEGMTSKAGNSFDAYLQFNADRKGLEYIFQNDRIFNRQELGGVALSPKQIEALNAGKAIFVEGMTGYDGKKFSQYVKADFNSGKLNYYNGNPDRDRSATQRNVVAEANKNKQAESQGNKRSSRRSVSQ